MKQIIHKINYILTMQERKKIWFLFVLMVIGGFLELLGVAGIFPLMDKLIGADVSDIRSIVFLAIILMVIYIAKNLFLLFMYRTIYRFVYDGRSKLSTRLFSVYMTEPYAFHLNRNIAIIQRAVRSDVDGFYNLVKALLQMMSEIIICIVLSVLLFLTDYKMATILVILLGTCVGSVLIVSKKKVRILGAEDMTYNAGMNQWLLQGIGGIKEIKLLKKEQYFIEKFQTLSQKSSMNQGKQQLLIQTPRLLTETVSILAVLIWIVIAAVSHTNLMETIPTLAVFAVAAFRLLPSVGKINGLLTEYQFYKSRVDFIYEDLNELEQCSVNLQNKNANVSGVDLRMNFQKEIQVRHISFSYANSERKILDDVSFNIPVGASIGIVGPSGAGKTTLVDIIMGLLEIKSGDITVDGKSIYENLPGWYTLIGYVPQVIYLSDDSIKKNIAFGIPEADIDVDKVNEVIRKAQMYDFISDMPDGLDTMIGDRGIRLSGGQRQRIGIARALYHDPEILILDEATSSLDNETESAVMNAIEALYGKVTMLVIAHRLTTIQSCDKIFHVEHGHVIQKEE